MNQYNEAHYIKKKIVMKEFLLRRVSDLKHIAFMDTVIG